MKWTLGLVASLVVASHAALPATAASRPVIGAPGKGLSTNDRQRLDAASFAHRTTRERLGPEDRNLLDRLTAKIRDRIFAPAPHGDLWAQAKSAARAILPGLSENEAATLAAYCLDSIAAGDLEPMMFAAVKPDFETQMSFNQQYPQLQSQMQNENRSYTAVSNIMKTKHDTIKNSIGNVR